MKCLTGRFVMSFVMVLTCSNARAESYLVQMPSVLKAFPSIGKFDRVLPASGFLVVDLDPDEALRLKRQGFQLERDVKVHALENSIHPGLPSSWHRKAIRADEANSLPGGQGEGVTVCTVDTGVNLTHPMLSDAVLGGTNTVDTNASDDFHDGGGHGTAVATLIAGRPYSGLVGVAPKAKIFAVKAMSDEGVGSLSSVIEGISRCIGVAQVINLSLGGATESKALREVIERARRAEISVVAAAGNDRGAIGSPANIEGVIAVGSINIDFELSEFSSRGPEMGFVAPGEDIPIMIGAKKAALISGTSMAAALVSGVEAIRHATRGLRLEAMDLGLPDDQQGAGLIDALASTRR